MKGRFGKDILPEKANIKCVSLGSVGNIAQIINSLYFMGDNCKEIYVDFIKKELMEWVGQYPYDNVLDQESTEDYIDVSCWGNMLFDWDEEVLFDIRNKIQPYFKFKDDLLEIVNTFAQDNNINENTLGVHIRMSDMNAWHGSQFGYVYIEDYIREIDALLDRGTIHNIFVASDNKETLYKLKKHYKDIIYYPDVARTNNEHEEGDEPSLRVKGYERMTGMCNFYTPFIDMLLLTKCGYFIGRKYSNFSIAAIMLGDMKYNNIINLS